MVLGVLLLCAGTIYAQTPGTEKWQTALTGAGSYPAIGNDFRLFISAYHTDYDSKLYAINNDGSIVWNVDLTTRLSSPVIGEHGAVYIVTKDYYVRDELFAFNPDGSSKWVWTAMSDNLTLPAIGYDDTLYIGSSAGKLFAINPDSSLKWEFLALNEVYQPVVGYDGTIYFVCNNGYFYAINPDGTLKWTYYESGKRPILSPSIGSDGTIYLPFRDSADLRHNFILAINSGGTKIWEYDAGWSYVSKVTTGVDGSVYFGSENQGLVALEADGTLKWYYMISGGVQPNPPSVGSDGTLYWVTGTMLRAFHSDGSMDWENDYSSSFMWTTHDISAPVIGHDNTIYIGFSSSTKPYSSFSGNLVAINANAHGPAKSSWPMIHAGASNTNRVQPSIATRVPLLSLTGFFLLFSTISGIFLKYRS